MQRTGSTRKQRWVAVLLLLAVVATMGPVRACHATYIDAPPSSPSPKDDSAQEDVDTSASASGSAGDVVTGAGDDSTDGETTFAPLGNGDGDGEHPGHHGCYEDVMFCLATQEVLERDPITCKFPPCPVH